LNRTNTLTRWKKQTVPLKDDEQNNIALRRRNHRKKTKHILKSLISIKVKKKRFRGVIWG